MSNPPSIPRSDDHGSTAPVSRERLLIAVAAAVARDGLPCPEMITLRHDWPTLDFATVAELTAWTSRLGAGRVREQVYTPTDGRPLTRLVNASVTLRGWPLHLSASEPAGEHADPDVAAVLAVDGDTRTCVDPGDAEHDHEMCHDVVAEDGAS